jgi:hypothetical protein
MIKLNLPSILQLRRKPKVIGWKIFYGDFTVVTSSHKSTWYDYWRYAPIDDVQVIVLFYDKTYEKNGTRNYVERLEGSDGRGNFYWFHKGRIGRSEKLTEVPFPSSIKFGRTLEKEHWLQIYNAAIKEDRWLSA